MKNRFKGLLLAVVLFSINYVSAQDESEEMKAWMEYMQPGEFHTLLATTEGNWTTETKFWMYPGSEAQTSEGSASSEMILGGRYLMTKHTGTSFGMPFEGIGIEAYDNSKEMFQSVWIDNMGSGITFGEGSYDEKEKTITYSLKMMNPETKQMETYEQVTKLVDDNNRLMEMYAGEGDNRFKMMEIKLVRAE